MIRYIVGIDYGHGETSAAFVDLEAVGTPVEDLTITGNEKKIHSMMASFAEVETNGIENVDPNDWVLSPDWATLRYALTPEKLSKSIPPFAAYFKGPVSKGRDGKSKEIDGIKKKMFGIFCKKVYDEIIENNKFLTPAVYDKSGNVVVESNFVLYVACPSGWEDNEKLGLRQVTAYKEFLIENGVPCQDIVKESRAAYVTARDTVLKGLTYQETPGVLIVDYGSSTIDLTWFGDKPAYTDGYELGARNVEEILFDYLLNNEEPAKTAYNNYTKYVHPLVAKMISKYGLRILKEDFFDLLAKSNIPDGAKKFAALNLGEVTPDEEVDFSDPDYRFTSSKPLRKEDIMHILETYKVTNVSLNDETYIGAVIERLRSFAESPEVGNIDYVVLTGGATRMTFLKNLVKSIYNIDDNHLIFDNIAPSFAISRGVATYGVKKFYSDPLLFDISRKLKEKWLNNKWLEPKLKDIISSTVFDVYKTELLNIMQRWVEGEIWHDEKHTLDDLFKTIIEQKKNDIDFGKIWYFVEVCDKPQNGNHSIHSLMRTLFDLVDDENMIKHVINEKINTTLSEYFIHKNDCLEEGLNNIGDESLAIDEENLAKDLEKYIKVYFKNYCSNNNKNIAFDLSIPVSIDVCLNFEKKIQLLTMLIEASFQKIAVSGAWGITTSSLNKDRLKEDFLGPGRATLLTVLVPVINEFSSTITSTYNISQCVSILKTKIVDLIEKIQNKCELSTYTLQ